MGLRDDLDRFREVGEKRREDLEPFIQHGDLGPSGEDKAKVPIKIVRLPSFEYDQRHQGGVGQGQGGQPDVGQPVGQPEPQPGDGDGEGEEGEPGDEPGEHEYYEMDPEEFAQELDEELGLDLDPKGKKVIEEKEGDFNEVARQGANLDMDYLIKEGIKRGLAHGKDEDYLQEVLQIDGWGPETAFEWARTDENIPVSKKWLEDAYADIKDASTDEDPVKWDSIEDLVEEHGEYPSQGQIYRRDPKKHTMLRRDDERYRQPEIIEEKEKNVVVVNIRDVSGSMRENKRELVERTFTPMDWYLQGKYDNAEFVYIAHDTDAWEVEREDFFGIKSGGGTKISSAYELAEELLEEYPWSDWNRYVFAAGDSENSSNDTENNVIPKMEEIPANLHAYVETQPGSGNANATHAEEVEDYFGDDSDDVAVAYVNDPEDVTDAIYDILSTESDE